MSKDEPPGVVRHSLAQSISGVVIGRYSMDVTREEVKIVVVGGGSGTSAVLRGLKY
jgi:uncharacterized protein (DUF697 family)